MHRRVKRSIVAIPVLLMFWMFMGADDSGCEEAEKAPAPDSDSSQSFKDGAVIPVDTNVYVIKGEVIGPVNEVTRQVEPAQGATSAWLMGGYGSMSGTFTGPIEQGKGFVRLRVVSSLPSTDLAPVGDVTIIKTSDTKVSALLTGDVVSFKCRRQYENIAAIKENEKFDAETLATWELDYCRMAEPVITVK